MMHYIIQIIAFQVFFLLIYDLFLKKETFFNWNRVYLLATAVLSIVIPFIKIESFKTVIPKEYIISLPEVIIGQTMTENISPVALDPVIIEESLSIWEFTFYIGAFIALSLFLYKLIKILVLVFKNPKIYNTKLTLVKLFDSNVAFSFFRYIFLGELLKEEDKKSIVKHEIVHVKQMHSIDLLFFEILRILFWFNPLIYMYQNRITILHEFIADAEAMKYEDKSNYYQSLLTQVFDTHKISFINPFFKQSLIKKRIIMLQKAKSKQIHLFKYVLLVPVVFGMLVYTSSDAQEKEQHTIMSVSSDKWSNDEELIEKLQKEYSDLKESGADFHELKSFFPSSAEYILTKEDYYRQRICFQDLAKNYKGGKSDIDNRTYAEYLELKKTDGLKELWENDTHDGVLKLVVNDLNNFSEEETQRFNKKKALLSKDVFFTSLKVTNVEGSAINMYFEPNEYSTANKRDDSKAVALNEVDLDVGFSVVEQVPVFPGCEDLTNVEQKKCLSNNISKFVNKNFNTNIATEFGLTGRQRINVIFKIDNKGSIVGVRSRAPHPALEEEAIRVIKLLPKMIPGEHHGKTVNVPYSLPIVFQVQDEVKTEEIELIPLDEANVEVPFTVIENVPVYPGCEDLASNTEKKKCMSQKISEFVSRKFNTEMANNLGLSGRQRINVIFKINKEGNITTDDVRARAPHIDLESEAIRVITELPKMKPGIQKGKAVTVPYSLPIIFEVKEKTKMLDEIIISDDSNINVAVPFAVVEKVPVYPGCESLETNEERKKCTTNNVNIHVNRNFNTKLADSVGLKGRQRINVIFKIDEKGNVTKIKSRAPHPVLENEAVRVIKSLPKMIPGEQKGKKVSVPYSLPIIFQVTDSDPVKK